MTELPKKYASFSLNQESSLTDTELLLGWTASEFHADAREKVGLRGIVSQVGLYVVHVEIAVACLQKNGESRAGGCVRKKVISPEQRRRAARGVVAGQLCSGRAACRFLNVSRFDVLVSEQRANEPGAEGAQAADGAKRKAWPLWPESQKVDLT